MLLFAGLALRDEYAVNRAGAYAKLSPAEAAALMEQGALDSADARPARAAVLMALAQSRAAFGSMQGPDRDRMLKRAQNNLDHVQATRPAWGDARVAQTYRAFVAEGVSSAAAHHAFAISYLEAGYLAQAAPWRLAFGDNQWRVLSAETRTAMLHEAVWYASDARHYLEVKTYLTDPDALERFRAEHVQAMQDSQRLRQSAVQSN